MNIKNVINRYYLYSFLTGMHFFSAVLTPFFTDWGGISLAAAQAIQSYFMFCVFVMEVPTGVVADMIGRKKSLFVGSIAVVAASLVYGSYPNIWLFIGGETLFAIGVAFASGADKALIYDSLAQAGMGRKSVEIFGKSKSIHYIGIAVGALMGSLIDKSFGINYPMLLTSIPAFVAALTAFSIPEPSDTGSVKEQRSFTRVLKLGFTPLRQNEVLRRWTINATLVSVAAYFVIWIYQPLMKSMGIPREYFGIAHAGIVFVEVLVSYMFKWVSKVFGSDESYIRFSAYAVSLSTLLVIVRPNYITLALFLALAGGLGLTRFELMSAHMNKVISSETRSTTLSAISMITRLSNAFLNPVVGFLTDRSVVFSLLVVFCLPLLTVLSQIKEKDIDHQ